jgi:hypothetical protein
MRIWRTAWMSAEHITNSLSVGAYTLDARDEVTAVAFEENAVFGPVVVDVVLVPDGLEFGIVLCLWVEDETVS